MQTNPPVLNHASQAEMYVGRQVDVPSAESQESGDSCRSSFLDWQRHRRPAKIGRAPQRYIVMLGVADTGQ
jgi:hypothetical protein